MNISVFSSRNSKEIIRDPLSIAFGIGLPLILQIFVSALQNKIGVDIFKIEYFTSGIAVFSFSFVSLFSGMLISKDRTSSFLNKLFSSPLSAFEYILGYTFPMLFIAIIQSVCCFALSIALGMQFNANIIYAVIVLIPVSLLFIAIGILLGSLFNDKQVGGIFAGFAQVVALSSGMWFDLNLIGGVMKSICYALPFAHAVDLVKGVVIGNYSGLFIHFIWIAVYTVVIYILAVKVFKKNMKN